MLRTDLVEVINSGKAWAFVGAGISVDAGSPTWKGLVEGIVNMLDPAGKSAVLSNKTYNRCFDANDFISALAVIEKKVTKPILDMKVREIFGELSKPSDQGLIISDWPFEGYITTNYDNLIEKALETIGMLGWAQIGNSSTEVKKISGGVSDVIWHLHGSIDLPDDKSKLILTENDYDELYLEETPAIKQMKSLLALRRVVFFGFGFKDPEVIRILKIVGKLCTPDRPAFAFLSDVAGSEHAETRKEYLEKFNVDIIPYRVVGGSHKYLDEVLSFYSSFIIKRSLKFGNPERECPSYDTETTSLLIYNNICLKESAVLKTDIFANLVKARILSLIKCNGSMTASDLVSSFEAPIQILKKLTSNKESLEQLIATELKKLVSNGLIRIDETATISLSTTSQELVGQQAAASSLLASKFSASIFSRAKKLCVSVDIATRISKAAESFLLDSIDKRALGVAMTRSILRPDIKKFHMTALLQELPKYMEQLRSGEEAIELTRLILQVLAIPSEAESNYIGVSLQAKFGIHVLGYDSTAVKTRAAEFSKTLFLIDSSTLIPLLARSCKAHYSAKLLIDRLKKLGSAITTTSLLTDEVAEHAAYAIQKVDATGNLNTSTLKALIGTEGERGNAFLEGFISEVYEGKIHADFFEYLSQIVHFHLTKKFVSHQVIQDSLKYYQINCKEFSDWDGFQDALWEEREETSKRIAELRIKNDSYRHERQVKAEAEALIIINKFRQNALRFDDITISDAYFISNTRVIDEVAGLSKPITMKIESVLHWVATTDCCTIEELSCLTDSLLWELNERGYSIIDEEKIQTTFTPLINASKKKLEEEIENYRHLVSQVFGENHEHAYKEVNPIDLPIICDSYYAQKAQEFEDQLKMEQKRRVVAEKTQQLTEKERREFEILKAKVKAKKRVAASKKRAAKSNPKRKK